MEGQRNTNIVVKVWTTKTLFHNIEAEINQNHMGLACKEQGIQLITNATRTGTAF